MKHDWVPDGYSDPIEYTRNDRHVAVVLIVLALLSFASVAPQIASAVPKYVNIYSQYAVEYGFPSSGMTGRVGATGLLALAAMAMWRVVVVPTHEALHYIPGLFFDHNPDFGYQEGLIFDNPRVVALTTGISVGENIVSLTAPFVVIGAISAGLAVITSGVVSGVAAFVFAANSAGSAQDIYHVIRLLRMDPDTLFANFETGDTITTEYAVPE